MPCYLWNNLLKREVFKSKKIKIEEKWTAVAIQARYDMGKQIAIRFGLHFWLGKKKARIPQKKHKAK